MGRVARRFKCDSLRSLDADGAEDSEDLGGERCGLTDIIHAAKYE
jgi:hypothetical protein